MRSVENLKNQKIANVNKSADQSIGFAVFMEASTIFKEAVKLTQKNRDNY